MKSFTEFLNENTPFEPGSFEITLKNVTDKDPIGSIHLEKTAGAGTISHIRMICKKLGIHCIIIDSEHVKDGGKNIGRFLKDEPSQKTLVVFDDVDRADKTIDKFIDDLIAKRNVLGAPISKLYYFSEVHNSDNHVRSYKNS